MKRVALLVWLTSLVFASGFGLGLNWATLTAGASSDVAQVSPAGLLATETGAETNQAISPEVAVSEIAPVRRMPAAGSATPEAPAMATVIPVRAAPTVDDLSPRLPTSARGSRSAVVASATPRAPVATATPRPSNPTATPPSVPSAGVERGGVVAATALRLVGSAYAWGGHSPATGFDCSGFTWYVYQQTGVAIPQHDLAGQMAIGRRVARETLQPGDLVFFQGTYKPGLSHAGVYIGGGRFVHAATEASGVRSDRIDDAYWTSHYLGASRP